MSNLNFNEVGIVIRINLNKDIFGTIPTLVLVPEVGEGKEITSGITIPNVQVDTDAETFCPSEYIEYTTQDGDLDYVGRWKMRATIEYSKSNIEKTNFTPFRVLP